MAGINFKSKKDKEWLDWLADDPVPASMRSKMRAKAVEDANQYAPRAQAKPAPHPHAQPLDKNNQTISVHISLPKFKKPNIQWSELKDKIPYADKRFIGVSAAVAVVIVGVGIVTVWPDSKQGKPEVLSQQTETADFDYSLPKGGKEALDAPVRYDSTRKVVNYKDTIGGVEITISQQPLPAGFETDTEAKVKKTAEDFSATKVLATANPTAYIGTSIKGPQTVIFSKKKLLVFIQSAQAIDDHDWAEYITNLQ